MILADTSVWIDHFRAGDKMLADLLERGQIVIHPWIVGELALGNLRNRDFTIDLLNGLPHVSIVDHQFLLNLISQERLHGLGVGYVDLQLMAAVRDTPDTLLWTRDRRLDGIAARLGMRFDPGEEAGATIP